MIYSHLRFSELPTNQLFSSFDCSTFRKPAHLERILSWRHKGLWLHHQVSHHTSSLVLTPPPWDGLASSQTCGWSNKTAALLKLKRTLFAALFFFFSTIWLGKKRRIVMPAPYIKRHTGITRVESNKTWLSGVNLIQWRRDQDGSNPLWTSSQVNPVHFKVHSYWRFSTGQSLSKLLSISKVQLWGELKRKKL